MSINANNAALNEILEAINELPEAGSGKEEQEKSIDITENGETVVTPDDENTTLSKVIVNVDVPIKDEQEKVVDITENGTTEVTPDEGMALSKVTVNVAVESGGGGVDLLAKRLDSGLGDFEYYSEEVTSLEESALTYCNITKLVLPNCTAISTKCCYVANKLKEIYLPNLKNVRGTQHFQNTAIEEVEFLKLNGNATCPYFGGSPNFKKLNLGYVYSIPATTFINCSVFETLIIRRTDGVPSLANVNAFNNTMIANGTGYIYVPKALIEDYKVATNWTTYANQFRALEDYTVDGTITGKLDESKI